METRIEELEGKIAVTLVGELDTAAAVEVEEMLQPLYKSDGRDVVIECSKLDYIASQHERRHQERVQAYGIHQPV